MTSAWLGIREMGKDNDWNTLGDPHLSDRDGFMKENAKLSKTICHLQTQIKLLVKLPNEIVKPHGQLEERINKLKSQ